MKDLNKENSVQRSYLLLEEEGNEPLRYHLCLLELDSLYRKTLKILQKIDPVEEEPAKELRCKGSAHSDLRLGFNETLKEDTIKIEKGCSELKKTDYV